MLHVVGRKSWDEAPKFHMWGQEGHKHHIGPLHQSHFLKMWSEELIRAPITSRKKPTLVNTGN